MDAILDKPAARAREDVCPCSHRGLVKNGLTFQVFKVMHLNYHGEFKMLITENRNFKTDAADQQKKPCRVCFVCPGLRQLPIRIVEQFLESLRQ